jgi:hypothetical protein
MPGPFSALAGFRRTIRRNPIRSAFRLRFNPKELARTVSLGDAGM